jgi:hypothetical protein
MTNQGYRVSATETTTSEEKESRFLKAVSLEEALWPYGEKQNR